MKWRVIQVKFYARVGGWVGDKLQLLAIEDSIEIFLCFVELLPL